VKELDNYYLQLNEPIKSCFIALHEIIISFDKNITPEWKYKLPFFYYKGKMLCYLWTNNKTKMPYIGFADGYKLNHPLLIYENTSRMKKLYIAVDEDLLINEIEEILKMAIALHN
jgi:hypothetical protein